MLRFYAPIALDVPAFDARDISVLLFLGIIGILLVIGIVLIVRHLLKVKKIRDDL